MNFLVIDVGTSGCRAAVVSITEATSLGTAIFCKAGLDKTRSLKEIAGEWIKVDKRFTPNKKHTRIYKELARLFEAQIKSNRDVYLGLNKLRRKRYH